MTRCFVILHHRAGTSKLGGVFTNKTRLWAAITEEYGADCIDALILRVKGSNRARLVTYASLCDGLKRGTVHAVTEQDTPMFSVRECPINQTINSQREADSDTIGETEAQPEETPLLEIMEGTANVT